MIIINTFKVEKHKGKNSIHGIIDDNGCWICRSHKPRKRYGRSSKFSYYQIIVGKRDDGKKNRMLMHRYIFELYNNTSIPKGMVVRHKCDNDLCINPEHLEIGTHKENMEDMSLRGRSTRGEKSSNSVLKEEDILEIRRLYKMKEFNQTQLSIMYNVSQRLISGIIRREYWSHI